MSDPTLQALPRSPAPAVGVVCFRGDEVLLIRRGRPPMRGAWSLPGGRIEWGERVAEAARREVLEETGLQVDMLGLVDVVDGLFPGDDDAPAGRHYVLVDLAARWVSGEPVAGDDASEAGFFGPGALNALGLWSETLRVIELARARYG